MLTVIVVHAQDLWMMDYQKALERARTEKKEVLLDFTGSDWCIWCQKLEKDLFDQSLFQKFAKENLVLLKVDFPQNKEQSDVLKKQNDQLQKQYRVEGFPTLILLDSEGKLLQQASGYFRGGPQAFITWVESARGDKSKSSKSF